LALRRSELGSKDKLAGYQGQKMGASGGWDLTPLEGAPRLWYRRWVKKHTGKDNDPPGFHRRESRRSQEVSI